VPIWQLWTSGLGCASGQLVEQSPDRQPLGDRPTPKIVVQILSGLLLAQPEPDNTDSSDVRRQLGAKGALRVKVDLGLVLGCELAELHKERSLRIDRWDCDHRTIQEVPNGVRLTGRSTSADHWQIGVGRIRDTRQRVMDTTMR
jgi:hypothetical protein